MVRGTPMSPKKRQRRNMDGDYEQDREAKLMNELQNMVNGDDAD
jgi:hypothetical protein